MGQYLQTYPDFFERNSALLARLRLPHAHNSGQTISLVERQVDVLRERNQGLERKLKELIDVARANEALTDKIYRFDRRLIRARNMAETVTSIEASLREDFEAMHAVLVLFVAPLPELEALQGRFLRLLATRARGSQDVRHLPRRGQAALARCAMRNATISSAPATSRSARSPSHRSVHTPSTASSRSAAAIQTASTRP